MLLVAIHTSDTESKHYWLTGPSSALASGGRCRNICTGNKR